MPAATPLIAAKVTPEVKAAFTDLARRQGLSESDLLRAVLVRVLDRSESTKAVGLEGLRRTGSKFQIRLREDELAAVEAMAAGDARSIPAWITALVRRHAMDVTPFNALELAALNRVIAVLGPIGRNINVLVKHFNQTGRARVGDLPNNTLEVVKRLRAEVVAVVDRANRRFDSGGGDG